ncbi:MAG: hypothetical protein K2O18_18290 [Oscillospiraceae bacterium]|nr:hypothetical protein [Oscillospiraceae bacterium]
MKLSKVLKFGKTLGKTLGAAAVLGSLIPYRISTDEDTGEKKYRALLWEATRTPQDDDTEKSLSVHVGFFNPFADGEAHMYADDLAVEYTPDDEEVEITEDAVVNEDAAEAEAAEEVPAEEPAEEQPAEEAEKPEEAE